MSAQTGMLKALGINMYTSLGKCLVEFAANSYDSDASFLRIVVPFDAIAVARTSLRESAKAEVKAGTRDPFTVLQDPLPAGITITIEDDGHGMNAQDVQNRFLPINRNRRSALGAKSESGKRFVMGRKGLGKLAAFGTAEQITIWTKRAGTTYATQFVMDYQKIEAVEDIGRVKLVPTYIDDLPAGQHGTRITLDKLRCDALKAGEPAIVETLADNFFGINASDFKSELNGKAVEAQQAAYEFEWPDPAARNGNNLGVYQMESEDVGKVPIEYLVKFRVREGDPVAAGTEGLARGSLPATRRGARVYCNGRLVSGPSLFRLKTGMHNFHSQSYMECIVNADELDRHDIDLVSTNRADLRTDNEIVDQLIETVTELMRQALYQHGLFRDAKVQKDIDKDELGDALNRRLSTIPKKSRAPAKRIMQVLASQGGVKGQLFQEVAPLVLDSMNAGEVLSRLIGLGTDPGSLQRVIDELANLDDVERRDLLKIFRGRRSAISALTALMDQANQSMRRGPHFEDQLHDLLKQNAWLIRPEYSRYLTSNKSLGDVAKKLNSVLKIDSEALDKDRKPVDPTRRPDLVFVAVESATPSSVIVVELKSPDIPLNTDHLTQLKDYMLQIRHAIQADHGREPVVYGHLIGNVPSTTTANSREERVLLDDMHKRGPAELWEILPLPTMLERTRKVHNDWIEALEEVDRGPEGDGAEEGNN